MFRCATMNHVPPALCACPDYPLLSGHCVHASVERRKNYWRIFADPPNNLERSTLEGLIGSTFFGVGSGV